jgi:hypothetical protein
MTGMNPPPPRHTTEPAWTLTREQLTDAIASVWQEPKALISPTADDLADAILSRLTPDGTTEIERLMAVAAEAHRDGYDNARTDERARVTAFIRAEAPSYALGTTALRHVADRIDAGDHVPAAAGRGAADGAR